MYFLQDVGSQGAGSYTCRNCVQVQLLNEHVELEKQLDGLRAIRENESSLDRTYSEVIMPMIQEERRCVTVREGSKRGVQETQVAVPNENRYALLGAVRADDASSPSSGRVGGSNPSDETRLARPTSGRAIVVGDSNFRGADWKILCRQVRIEDSLFNRLQNILEREEVVQKTEKQDF